MGENNDLNVNGSDVYTAIMQALKDAKKGLSKDSLVAVVSLQNEIEIDRILTDLLKEGKIEAKYKGDKSARGEALMPEDFIFLKKGKAGQQSSKEESQE